MAQPQKNQPGKEPSEVPGSPWAASALDLSPVLSPGPAKEMILALARTIERQHGVTERGDASYRCRMHLALCIGSAALWLCGILAVRAFF